MLALRREESAGDWTVLVRAETVGEIAKHIAATEECQREQSLQIINDFDDTVLAQYDVEGEVWSSVGGRMSAEDVAILTATTEPGVRIEIRDGQPVCSKCGGSVQCSGTLNCSMVNVNADCFGGGEVELTYDYMDAGAADFVPTEFHCVDCGAVLVDPGDLTCEDDEADEAEE